MCRFNQKNQINRFVNEQRVLQVILEEQLLVDGFTGKKSKEAASSQKAIDFLKGRGLKIREMIKAVKQNQKINIEYTYIF